MTTLSVREAVKEDAGLILSFIRDLARYEKAEHCVQTDEQQIAASLFAEGANTAGLICLADGQPIGFAVYFYNYSTWLGRKGLYLEDLYVAPEFRGIGAGKFLLQQLARQAVAEGCGRFEWSVLDWNQPAIDFYESIGAVAQSEWIGYRLEGERLTRFADA